MNNSYDLMTIYGIPPARYDENNPGDLFLKDLPSFLIIIPPLYSFQLMQPFQVDD